MHCGGCPGPRQREQRRPAQQPGDHAGRKERFRKLQELTASLRSFVASEEEAQMRALEACRGQLQANAVLHHREYAFCLFPEGQLRPFCEQFLHTPTAGGI